MNRSHRSLPLAVGSLLIVAALLAGCGASGSSSSGGGDAEEVAAAKAATEEAKKPATEITVTTPLLEPADLSGETIVLAKCDSPQCEQIESELILAAEAVGAEVKSIPFKSADPATLVAALTQGLEQYDPIAGVVTGSPRAVWEDAARAYGEAGKVLVAEAVGPLELDDTVIASVDGDSGVEFGNDLANWFIADSEGAGKALLYNVQDFPTLKIVGDSFMESVEKGCSGCDVELVKGAVSDVMSGGAPEAIVSALQRNPDVEYVVLDNGGWAVGLPAALDAAGLEDVKIAAQNANSINLTDMQTGSVDALTGSALRQGSWYIVDAILRHQQGMEPDPGVNVMPTQLITPEIDFTVSDTYDLPADYADQFKELWQIG